MHRIRLFRSRIVRGKWREASAFSPSAISSYKGKRRSGKAQFELFFPITKNEAKDVLCDRTFEIQSTLCCMCVFSQRCVSTRISKIENPFFVTGVLVGYYGQFNFVSKTEYSSNFLHGRCIVICPQISLGKKASSLYFHAWLDQDNKKVSSESEFNHGFLPQFPQ